MGSLEGIDETDGSKEGSCDTLGVDEGTKDMDGAKESQSIVMDRDMDMEEDRRFESKLLLRRSLCFSLLFLLLFFSFL